MTDLADIERHGTIVRVGETRLPTRYGEFRAVGYLDQHGHEHLAAVHGDLTGFSPLTRVHSECLTGDVFGSTRCECGEQLDASLREIVAAGAGVVIYLTGHEGRGIGLVAKLRAMRLQEEGMDTVEANVALGFAPDLRDYGEGAQMLVDLGIHKVRLMTNNPCKIAGLDGYGIEITERVPVVIPANCHDQRYLDTKKTKMGHLI